MQLQGKVAIVTGSGQGIGRALAMGLVEAGADLVSADIDLGLAQDTARAAEALGRRALAVKVDVGDPASIDGMVAQVMKAFGQIDILVNNAGTTRRAAFFEITEEDWDRIHRVNAKGVFFCLQKVAAEMVKRRYGKIINVASIAGKGYAGTSNAAYAASKGAVISLTKTAAQQLAPYDINVNSICPGITRSRLFLENLTVRAKQEGLTVEEMEKRRAAVVPLGRFNDPEDLAPMVVFLATEGARNITGQCYNIDGGVIMD